MISVSYYPARKNAKYGWLAKHEMEVRSRQAFVAAAARNGTFQLVGKEAHKVGDYLRDPKRYDPTLGLYAAYAYAQAGHFDQVRDVLKYMKNEPEPTLFDVAMLARAPLERVAPGAPMLTQGWSLIEVMGAPMPDYVKAARHELIPALWNTLTPRGVEILRGAMERGELR